MVLIKTEWVGGECKYLAQERDQMWVVVNMTINLQVPYKAGNVTS
jgi:hypothetical protein